MRRKLISIILAVWVLLTMPVTAYAEDPDGDRLGSVSVTLMDPDGITPISGAELSLYCVASAEFGSDDRLRYTFTQAFADCGCALDDPALSANLDVFVAEHSPAAEKMVSDAYGKVSFMSLPLGLYFVKQTGTAEGYAPCASFLVTVPYYDTDGYVYDVNATPKAEVAKLGSVTIRKVWNTDASVKATDSVTVHLLRDGTVVETAMLSEQNDWQVTYTDMPESDAYSVVEVDVPKGFTATYSQNGHVFTVTNSAVLIQTGQLIWPIPVLAVAGLCLLAVGTVVLRKTRDQNA